MDTRHAVRAKGRESGMPEASCWETFFNPRCILEKLDCRGTTGDAVEFGCGYGTFTIPAAQHITGRVFALDIEPALVAETIQKGGSGNWGPIPMPANPAVSADEAKQLATWVLTIK